MFNLRMYSFLKLFFEILKVSNFIQQIVSMHNLPGKHCDKQLNRMIFTQKIGFDGRLQAVNMKCSYIS